MEGEIALKRATVDFCDLCCCDKIQYVITRNHKLSKTRSRRLINGTNVVVYQAE